MDGFGVYRALGPEKFIELWIIEARHKRFFVLLRARCAG